MIRFWTADLHLGHANIARYCHRPQLKPGDLDSAGNWVSPEIAHLRSEQMSAALIRDCNMRVKPGDTVVSVGDLACRGGEKGVEGLRKTGAEWLSQLNGNWVVVSGNHDEQNSVKPVCDFMSCEIAKYQVGVQHIPLYDPEHPPQKFISEQRKKYLTAHSMYCADWFDFIICGHVHDAWKVRKIAGIWHVNVGVDVCRYMPINDTEVIQIYEKARMGEVQK